MLNLELNELEAIEDVLEEYKALYGFTYKVQENALNKVTKAINNTKTKDNKEAKKNDIRNQVNELLNPRNENCYMFGYYYKKKNGEVVGIQVNYSKGIYSTLPIEYGGTNTISWINKTRKALISRGFIEVA